MKNRLTLIFLFIVKLTIAQVSDFKTIDFTRADNIAKLNANASLKNLPLLAYNLTYKLDNDAEKFRAIYTWVCTNIKGDLNQDHKVSKQRKRFKNDSLAYLKWNNAYQKTAFKKLLKHKKTMCTGYAYLIKELCFLANLDCKMVNGYGRSTTTNVASLDLANHSWNAVKLNNKWYLCDATWSSGYFVNDVFIKDYNLGYFLTDPTLFAKNHYPLDKKWLLNDTLITSDYSASPIVYGDTFTHKIIPIGPSNLNTTIKKDDTLVIRFKSLNSLDTKDISLIKYSGFKTIPYKITNLKNDNGLVSFNYKFETNGVYDVHLKIKNDIVATYTISVITE